MKPHDKFRKLSGIKPKRIRHLSDLDLVIEESYDRTGEPPDVVKVSIKDFIQLRRMARTHQRLEAYESDSHVEMKIDGVLIRGVRT